MQAPGWWSGVRPIVLSVVVWLTALPGLVAAQAPTGEPIKIGAVLSLTGPGAGLGLAERSGIQLAEKTINEHGGVKGRPLKIVGILKQAGFDEDRLIVDRKSPDGDEWKQHQRRERGKGQKGPGDTVGGGDWQDVLEARVPQQPTARLDRVADGCVALE